MQETLERQSSGKTRPERYSVLTGKPCFCEIEFYGWVLGHAALPAADEQAKATADSALCEGL